MPFHFAAFSSEKKFSDPEDAGNIPTVAWSCNKLASWNHDWLKITIFFLQNASEATTGVARDLHDNSIVEPFFCYQRLYTRICNVMEVLFTLFTSLKDSVSKI